LICEDFFFFRRFIRLRWSRCYSKNLEKITNGQSMIGVVVIWLRFWQRNLVDRIRHRIVGRHDFLMVWREYRWFSDYECEALQTGSHFFCHAPRVVTKRAYRAAYFDTARYWLSIQKMPSRLGFFVSSTVCTGQARWMDRWKTRHWVRQPANILLEGGFWLPYLTRWRYVVLDLWCGRFSVRSMSGEIGKRQWTNRGSETRLVIGSVLWQRAWRTLHDG